MSLQKGWRRIKTNVEDSPIWQRFRRNVSISLLGSGLSLAIRLGQTALLTKVLRIEDYGRLLIVLNLFVFLDSFFGLRVSDVIFRFYPPLKAQKNWPALKGLLLLCLSVCLASGLLIYGGVVILSPWLADRLYPGLGLTPLFNIYGCTILISAFTGVYEPILRLHDRFTSIVAPQVIGGLVTLAILCIYFATSFTNSFSTNQGYSLNAMVAAFAVGALIQTVPPLLQAMQLMRPLLSGIKAREAAQALVALRRELAGCFVNSNLSGYLKFAIAPGDVFLLGLFSSPTQLALYGVARQLTAPLALLQTNIQTAITPEVTALVAEDKFAQLKRLVGRYVGSISVIGAVLLVSAAVLGRLVIFRWIQAEYLAALPVFYILTIVACLLLVFVVFRPLAVSLDLLRWHNLVLLLSACLVFFFIFTGKLNALTMAYSQLAAVLILRSLFSGLVWNKLKRLEFSKEMFYPKAELE